MKLLKGKQKCDTCTDAAKDARANETTRFHRRLVPLVILSSGAFRSSSLSAHEPQRTAMAVAHVLRACCLKMAQRVIVVVSRNDREAFLLRPFSFADRSLVFCGFCTRHTCVCAPMHLERGPPGHSPPSRVGEKTLFSVCCLCVSECAGSLSPRVKLLEAGLLLHATMLTRVCLCACVRTSFQKTDPGSPTPAHTAHR